MAETLKVSQEAHSQVVGEMKAEIDKLKSDLKKANEKKDVAMARLLESLLKREPSTTNQEKWNMKDPDESQKSLFKKKCAAQEQSQAAISKDEIQSL